MSFTPLYIINSYDIYAPFDIDLKSKFLFRINCEKNPIKTSTRDCLLKNKIFKFFSDDFEIFATNKFYKMIMKIKSKNENIIFLKNYINNNSKYIYSIGGNYIKFQNTNDFYLYLSYILKGKYFNQ